MTSIGSVALQVPRTRKGFTSLVFERYQRRQAELDQAIGEMFVKGASTTQVGEIVETLAGLIPGGSAVVNRRLRARFTADAWVAEQMSGVSQLFFLRSLLEAIEHQWEAVLSR